MLLFLGTACQEPKKETPEFVFPASSPVEKILAKGFLDVSTFYSTTDYYIYKGITRGFHYELAQSFADFLGVKLRIIEVNNNLDSAIHRLREGKYDLIAVSMTVTPERQEKSDLPTHCLKPEKYWYKTRKKAFSVTSPT